jgi:16S rRNA (cytidine1402-2'-O)-methyltransferase
MPTLGSLFLIPTSLSSDNTKSFFSPIVMDILRSVTYYLVENPRTTRRFISSLKLDIQIEELQLEVLNKKSTWEEVYDLLEPARNGNDMGIISEAGLPCLADPGHLAVACAHQIGLPVVPLPGTSSIQLALIASGFNGQQFTFHGYIPIDKSERVKRLKELEKASQKGITQLFMETPYRNNQLVQDILHNCQSHQLLSIAANISGSDAFIQTKSVEAWRKSKVDIHKKPAIFSFGQFS